MQKPPTISQCQIILDTETTGLYPEDGDRLVEFTGLEMINHQMADSDPYLYVHPKRDTPEEAAKVHGLMTEVLGAKNAPSFAQVGKQIADFIRGVELIIHNVKFDTGFLNMELRRVGLSPTEELGRRITDALTVVREMFPGQRTNLSVLRNRLSVGRNKRVLYDTLIDCELLDEVYPAMMRQQFGLMDGEAGGEGEVKPTITAETKHTSQLKVVKADAGKLAVHEKCSDDLDEACVWCKTGTSNEASAGALI